jgi:hypothetical protein
MSAFSQEELFEQNVAEIRTQIRQLKSSIEMSRLVINEHCLEQTRLVDIETETKIEKSDTDEIEALNERRKRWLREISEYEAGCVQHMEATKGQLFAYIGLTEQWLESHRDSPDRSVLIHQSDEHLTKLTMLGFELKGFQFGARLLLFNEEYRSIFRHDPARLILKNLRVPTVLENYYKEKLSCLVESSKVIFMYLSP